MDFKKTASSTPLLQNFNPKLIPFQFKVVRLVRKEFDYSNGSLEILLSGSVGSAKSLLVAHLAITHAMNNAGAGVLIGRRTLKDLKNTIWSVLLKHFPGLKKYWNKQEMKISLPNGSVIYGVSWDDGNYDKFRSYELSFIAIEELTENSDKEIYDELRMRLGRLPHIEENVFICATNPDSPAHWAYKYFIENQSEERRVFYSKTSDNPFLPPTYIRQLRSTLDEKQAKRMLEGVWIEINQEIVYYNYSAERNFKKGVVYEFDPNLPVDIMHDFNIGFGKPMSSAIGQFKNGVFHVAKTFLVQGARTLDICEEMDLFGQFTPNREIRIFGDATGSHNDTRNNQNDYDIILKFLGRKNCKARMNVNPSNPRIRDRNNLANAFFFNDLGEVKVLLYEEAKDADEGFRLTKYKKGANLIEDDSFEKQHVTTAITYWIYQVTHFTNKPKGRIQIL